MVLPLLACGFGFVQAHGQCAATATTPLAAAECARRSIPPKTVTPLVSGYTYTLAELINLAEVNHPRTQQAWERARQAADRLGVEKSAYFPVLAAAAVFADQRTISPFPKPLAPRGYTMVEVPLVQPELTLDYLLFDFGRREARVDAATAGKLAAGAQFIQANQEVAFRVASAYYRLLTAQERLTAAKETYKTAQTTQEAAEAQLLNGRSTLPDVLNARAETSQAAFDLQSADGDEQIARVTLTEAVGVEPSPDIAIEGERDAPLPATLTLTIDALIDRALADRPDLMAQAAEIRSTRDDIRIAHAAYRPSITLSANGAQTSIWPTSDYGELGSASEPTWSATLAVQWRLFDGGARRHELDAAQARSRAAEDELREMHDDAVRQVWTAYIAFRTAMRKQQASVDLLHAADTSYSASLEAYNYGVKNLIDVVTAERQLAQARLSSVTARSQLLLEAVDLEFVSGNLLRHKPPATERQPPQPPPQETTHP